MKQITDTIMMIRPKHFGYNPETAENNAFQASSGREKKARIEEIAQKEFDALAAKLREVGVVVDVIEDTDSPELLDSVFPNNWISTHDNGAIITYPMYSKIRRQERREDIVKHLKETYGFDRRYSFEYYEEEEMFLEGTGSLVMDRVNQIAYACISDRTHPMIIDKWAVLTGYKTVIFHAIDPDGTPIYHTNVMMALGENYAIICLECIAEEDRPRVIKSLTDSGYYILAITFDQVQSFAGNMLEVRGKDLNYLVMSTTAYNSLTQTQLRKLAELLKILHSDISTIETYGGGSVRCMLAEIFPPSNI